MACSSNARKSDKNNTNKLFRILPVTESLSRCLPSRSESEAYKQISLLPRIFLKNFQLQELFGCLRLFFNSKKIDSSKGESQIHLPLRS